MQNGLYYISEEEVSGVKAAVPDGVFIAEIDYERINCDSDYLDRMGELFRFPVFEGQTGHSWDGYFDWITDLNWENDSRWLDISRNGFCLIIHGCNKNGYDKRFDPLLRRIVDGFVYDILPFWKKDIKDVVVCGESKAFSVYLVI